MYIIKANGEKEQFDLQKIVKTLIRNEVEEKKAKEIAQIIKNNIKEGASTHEIYKMITDELEKLNSPSTFLFQLRDAIANIDSESYELYTQKILEAHGYECKWNVMIMGRYVEHQVDVVASKGKESYLVECKRHFNPHRICGLDVTLQVQARLEDIKDGFSDGKNKYNFSQAWIFNNTKFSEHAKHYANGKRILLSGWKYKDDISIESLAHSKKVFPITILKADLGEIRNLLSKKVITCQDLLKTKGYENLKKQAEMLLK